MTTSILNALTDRVSSPKLTDPGPSQEQLRLMFRAALRAPDHACLQPWRFVTIKDDARKKLGDLFVEIAYEDNPDLSESILNYKRQLPLRAPMIVVLILHYKKHPKVPKIEQLLSVGAAGNALITAAFHLGIGSYWRTGDICFDQRVANALDLVSNEKIMGFIYLGTPVGDMKSIPNIDINNFVRNWKG